VQLLLEWGIQQKSEIDKPNNTGYHTLFLEHPEVLKEMKRKNTSLDDRLRQVFVLSNDPEHNIKQKASEKRPLPMNRKSPAVPEFGFQEPDNVAEGKVTFKQAIKFITDHQEDSKKWNKDAIAQHYKLDSVVVGK
jgi:Uncharacterised protein family (UPF0240)